MVVGLVLSASGDRRASAGRTRRSRSRGRRGACTAVIELGVGVTDNAAHSGVTAGASMYSSARALLYRDRVGR